MYIFLFVNSVIESDGFEDIQIVSLFLFKAQLFHWTQIKYM